MHKQFRMSNTKRVAWHDGEVLHVIRLGKTTNAKIAEPWMQVLQTYHFDLRQLALVRSHLDGKNKFSMKDFFDLDEACCLDCPLSNNAGDGNCYTHKVGQYKGFLSMLRSICKNDEVFYGLDAVDRASIMKMAERADYIRFGTYGEPSLLPIDLVGDIVLSKRPESQVDRVHTPSTQGMGASIQGLLHGLCPQRQGCRLHHRVAVLRVRRPGRHLHGSAMPCLCRTITHHLCQVRPVLRH